MEAKDVLIKNVNVEEAMAFLIEKIVYYLYIY